jgi:hypothetical protein
MKKNSWVLGFFLINSAALFAANTLTIHDAGGAGVSYPVMNCPVQIGRPFLPGEFPEGSFPEALLNGIPANTQVDVKTRWPNRSLKHAVLTFYIPSLASGQTITVTFRSQSTGRNSGSLTKTQMLDAAYNFEAVTELNGSVSASARAMMNADAYQLWLQGEQSTSVILADHSAARSFDLLGGDFRPVFLATFFPQANRVRVRFIGENTTVGSGTLRDAVYSLVLRAGHVSPVQVFTQNPVLHSARSRWTREFWIGAPLPKVDINHNLDYLKETGLIPNYKHYEAAEVALSATSEWTQPALYAAGSWQKGMGTTGGRQDIGPYPAWTARWLYTGDHRERDRAFGLADLAAAWPMHYREGTTGKFFDRANQVDAMGRVFSVHARPGLYIEDGSERPSGSDTFAIQTTTTNIQGWSADAAHQPDPFTAQYMLSGDYWYLEQMYFWASWSTIRVSPGGRGRNRGGLPIGGPVRALAWVFRNRARVASLAPDGSPEKAYFELLTEDAIAQWEGFINLGSDSSYYNMEMWIQGRNQGQANQDGDRNILDAAGAPPLHQWPEKGTAECNENLDAAKTRNCNSPWMQNFLMFSLGEARDMGYVKVQPLISWFARYLIGQLTDPGFSPHYLSGSYRMPATRFNGTYFSTWSEVKDAYRPDTYLEDCSSGLCHYGQDYAPFRRPFDYEGGYSIILVPAAAVVAGEPQGGSQAWDFINNNILAYADFRSNPTWAIEPRRIGPADPVPPSRPQRLRIR